jgi:predicted Rossmann fold nucleotide-binding protein DprA/Smf involved in DNA uptake
MIVILSGQLVNLRGKNPGLPPSLLARLGSKAPVQFWFAGPLQLLSQPKTGLFCSSQCPGSIVLKAFDAVTRMRDEGRILIGGFHSVMEWECLKILLRGRQPVIWVPGRSIVGMQLRPELVPAFNAGRLLILSPFPPKQKRVTAALAEQRNRFVAVLADKIFVPHAAPKSHTLALCRECHQRGAPVFTIDDPKNGEIASIANSNMLAPI